MLLKALVTEFGFDCGVRELSPRTIRNYEKQLSYFLNFLESKHSITALEDVTPAHIKEFINIFQLKGCKPSYINDLLKAIKCLFAYAFKENYTSQLLTKNIKNLKEPTVLIHTFSSAEIADMINYHHDFSFLSVRNKVITMILFDTGIRVAELINMMPNQIQDGYFIIHGKGRKERLVPLSPLVGKWLRKYLSIRNSYFEYRFAANNVFLSKNGKPLTEEAISKFLKNTAKAVHVNPNVRVSPHTLRHTFAHEQLKNGIDIVSLSRLLGHTNISITQRYLNSIEDSHILSAASKTGVLANLTR